MQGTGRRERNAVGFAEHCIADGRRERRVHLLACVCVQFADRRAGVRIAFLCAHFVGFGLDRHRCRFQPVDDTDVVRVKIDLPVCVAVNGERFQAGFK